MNLSINDTRTIHCNHCADIAVEVDPALSANELDGRECSCAECLTPGRIVVCDDEGSVWLEFRIFPMHATGLCADDLPAGTSVNY